ncbi:hypothetical protein FJ365_01200 [Candidatus Dependentiae bacterium]|nr:hypothetical protein [Candidatus Dependentiae bacterium]
MKNITLIFAVSLALIMNPAIAATRKQIEKVRKQQDDAGLQRSALLVKRRLLEIGEFEVAYSDGTTFITAWGLYDRTARPWWLDLEAVQTDEYVSDEDVDTAPVAYDGPILAELEARLARLRE